MMLSRCKMKILKIIGSGFLASFLYKKFKAKKTKQPQAENDLKKQENTPE